MLNNEINLFIKHINGKLTWYEVNLGDKKKDFCYELKQILKSNMAGVYFIRTNTPIEVLINVGCPVVDVNNHKNIPKII